MPFIHLNDSQFLALYRATFHAILTLQQKDFSFLGSYYFIGQFLWESRILFFSIL